MKKLFFRTVFLFTILCLPIFAQDPGTVISINLFSGGVKISKVVLSDYNVKVQMVNPFHQFYDEKTDLTGDSAMFHFFDWLAYKGEIYEILIVHSQDTMNIRFQMSLDSSNSHKIGNDYSIWNAYFYLNIPFQTGYFEITDFIKGKSNSYKINAEHIWLPLTPENRKLH